MKPTRTDVESPLHPGKTTRVDAAKYAAMRAVMLAAMPATAPGFTVAELTAALKPNLPQDLFPGGETAGWWVKCVQLDLEAKAVIIRTKTSPLRLHRT